MALALLCASAAGAQERADARAGREVFEQNCAMCHGADASGMMGMHPSLRGAIDRLSRDGVEVTIRSGRAVRPPMPAFAGRLSDGEISDVIAYIDTLPAGPRNFGPETAMTDDVDDMIGDFHVGSGEWLPWALVGVLTLALAGTAIALARARPEGRRGRSRALDVLEERYAAGDIDHEEFEQRRRTLAP